MNCNVDILIVGGGFGGIYALYKLRQLGLSIKLVEAGSYFGGVWHWNRYPGARCDSEIPHYQLSIPEVYQGFNWKERYPGHEEMRRYARHCDAVLCLSKDAIFDTIVHGVLRDGDRWRVETTTGPMSCRFLIAATGSSYKAYKPQFPGLSDFTGAIFHSTDFPTDFDPKGKKIGLIGNGATGVQIVQDIAKEDCQLTVFIRTPVIAVPMLQRAMSVDEQRSAKSYYDVLFRASRASATGLPFDGNPKSIFAVTDEERESTFERLWATGGLALFASNYPEVAFNKTANRIFYDFWLRKVRPLIQDAEKRDVVAPLEQPYYILSRRPSLMIDYYQCIDRPNVSVVNLETSPIQRFDASGILTDRLHELDVIILATGFDALTGSLINLNMVDKDGVKLEDKWKTGVTTHLGMMIPGMPNFFMVYSPQAPTALANAQPVIEIQVDWIFDAISKVQAEGIDALDAEEEAAQEWRDAIQAMNAQTLFPLTNSWYMGANIPGKVVEQLNYVGGVGRYAQEIRAALDTEKGFIMTKNVDSVRAG